MGQLPGVDEDGTFPAEGSCWRPFPAGPTMDADIAVSADTFQSRTVPSAAHVAKES